ncbi:MAG: hypothetical protein JRJ56_05140 [Deltaproteobacteria bacterium]|nr:hypothetical protein [Deltaproteobacteria bacterium]
MGKNVAGRGSPLAAEELLEIYFLEMRSALLETAAAFDRLERAAGGERVMEDPRVKKLLAGCELITAAGADRAERFLLLFSDGGQTVASAAEE